jgi:hypothetical protein
MRAPDDIERETQPLKFAFVVFSVSVGGGISLLVGIVKLVICAVWMVRAI